MMSKKSPEPKESFEESDESENGSSVDDDNSNRGAGSREVDPNDDKDFDEEHLSSNEVPTTTSEVELMKKKRKVHKLSMNRTEDFNATLKRRGVVYISRVPPRMNPSKLKRMLQEISECEITRVYLVEEDSTVRKRRRKEGGNGSKRYIEGWIEFASKKVAKHVAAALNTTPITNQKRSVHYGDLWCLKYLHKFRWSHLTEKVAYERRVKEQKLRLETMQARRETAAFKQLVETGKKLDKIEERKRRREEKQQQQKEHGQDTMQHQNKKRKTKQLAPLDDGAHKSTHQSLLRTLV